MRVRKLIAALIFVMLFIGGCGSTDNKKSLGDEVADAVKNTASQVIMDAVTEKLDSEFGGYDEDAGFTVDGDKNTPYGNVSVDLDTIHFDLENEIPEEDMNPEYIYFDVETGEVHYDETGLQAAIHTYYQEDVYEYESDIDYYIIVDGDAFILPMGVQAIKDMGWEFNVITDNKNAVMPGTSVACDIKKNDVTLAINLMNKTKDIVTWEECSLVKVRVGGSDWLDKIPEIEVCYGVDFDLHSDEINDILSQYKNLRKADESNTSIQYWDELPADESGYSKYAGMCLVGMFDYDGDIVSDSVTIEYLGK